MGPRDMVATTELQGKRRDRERDKLNWSNDGHAKRNVKNCPGRFFPPHSEEWEDKMHPKSRAGESEQCEEVNSVLATLLSLPHLKHVCCESSHLRYQVDGSQCKACGGGKFTVNR